MNLYLFREQNNKIYRYVLEVEKETDKYFFLKQGNITYRARIHKEVEIGAIVDFGEIFLLEDNFELAKSLFCESHKSSMNWHKERAEEQRKIMEQIEKMEKAEE
jgi:hypothetical protein